MKKEDNQTMKFGPLIGNNIRNIYVKTLYTKCGEETIPWRFSKKLELSLSLDQYSQSFMHFVFIVW